MNTLEFSHVDFSIGGRLIVRDVSLAMETQQTLAILGASGSGKSTILRLIMGLIRPDRGQVKVLGQDITRMAYRDLVQLRRRMGIVFQGGALFDSLTVGENVGYYLMEQQHMSHAQAEPRIRAMLNLVGLEDTMDMMPEELSGGMRRRVAIARTMIYQPQLILYDEPTTGLDPIASNVILDLINRLKRENKVTSVVVTHDLDDAAALGDCFVVIREGSVAWSAGRRQFLSRQSEVVQAYYR